MRKRDCKTHKNSTVVLVAMAYCTSGWAFFVLLLHVSLLTLPCPILSDHSDLNEEEENLLDGLNKYRDSHNLPDLLEVRGADCLADKIASQFEDSQSCFVLPTEGSYSISAGSGNSIPGYYRLLGDCNLNIDSTKDGVILPACVGDIDGDITYVTANFTQTAYAQYLRNSDYTGIGIGSEGAWLVLVLTTDNQDGDFSAARTLLFAVGPCFLVFAFMLIHWL